MDGQSKVNLDMVFFHGSHFDTWGKGRCAIPSVTTPVYLYETFSDACHYGRYIFPVYLNQNAKVFSWYSKEDVLSLKGKTFYKDDTIDMLSFVYNNSNKNWFNLWAMGHDYDNYFLEWLRKTFIEEMENHGGTEDYENHFPENVKSFLGDFSILFNPIYHGMVDKSKITTKDINAAKTIVKELRRAGLDSVHEMCLKNEIDEEWNWTSVKIMMTADVIDAMASGKFGFPYMTFRRPLYDAIAKDGYSVILDSMSDEEEEQDEIAVIDRGGLDRILSKPIPIHGQIENPITAKIAEHLHENDRVTKAEFERMLNDV